MQFPQRYDYTISDLSSTGNLKLIRNDSLRNSILDYYNGDKTNEIWIQSFIENRSKIDLEVNYILDKNTRSAYNTESTFQYFNTISLDEMSAGMKKRPDLKPLAVGMYHIHARITRHCRRGIKDAHSLMQKIRNELDK